MSTDQDWIGLDQDWSHFWPDQDWIGLQFFEIWRITTGSDWENFCFNVIILNISKISVVIRPIGLMVVYILPSMAKALLGQFYNLNCIHLCPHITLSSSSNVNTIDRLVSMSMIWMVSVYVSMSMIWMVGVYVNDIVLSPTAISV